MYNCMLEFYFYFCIHAKSVYVKFVDLTSDIINAAAAVIALFRHFEILKI